MLNSEVTQWLEQSGLPVRQNSRDRWSLRLSHRFVNYDVTITNTGSWLHYGADLASDVTGTRVNEFYRRLLELNSQLNGVHIAIQHDRISLIRDEYAEDVDENHLFRSLDLFHRIHQYVYGCILDIAEELDVYFISP